MSRKHTIHEYSVQEAQNIQLGQAGYEYLENQSVSPADAGTSETDHFIAITILSTTTRLILTAAGGSSHNPDDTDDPLHLSTPPAGLTLYGNWKAVSVTSTNGSDKGKAIVYKG